MTFHSFVNFIAFFNIIKANFILLKPPKMASTSLTIVLLTILGTLSTMTHSRCMYDINESDLMPLHIDKEPFLLKDLHGCKDYLEPGRLGCCSHINDVLTEENFKQIDAVFGSDGGGCDICAINLKRFWC